MIQFTIFSNKNGANCFMVYLILLCFSMVSVFCNTLKKHSAVQRSIQNNGNESLSQLDFEDTLNSEVFTKPNASLSDISAKNEIIPKEKNGDLFKTKVKSQCKKHKNIIKMVCDSDNLISEMTLHMNFIESNPKQRRNYFTFEKAFDPKEGNSVSFSFPEVPDGLYKQKLKKTDYPEYAEAAIDDLEKESIQLGIKKPINENVALKRDNNINGVLLDEDDTQLNFLPNLQKINQLLNEPKNEGKYKSEIKKFNGGPRINLFKFKKGNHSSKLKHQMKIENSHEFNYRMTTENMPKVDIIRHFGMPKNKKKNGHQKKLLFTSLLTKDSVGSSSTSSGESNLDYYDQYKYSSINKSQDAGKDIKVKNDDSDIRKSFDVKECDTESINEDEVLNNSTAFKKHKLEDVRHNIINHKLNSVKFPAKKLPMYSKSTDKCMKGSVPIDNFPDQLLDENKSKEKNWKGNLVSKTNNISSSDMLDEISFSTTLSIIHGNRKKQGEKRQKVIQNLKFILSNEVNTDKNGLHQIVQDFPKQEIWEENTELNLSKISDKEDNNYNFKMDETVDDHELFEKNDDDDIDEIANSSEIDFSVRNDSTAYDVYNVGNQDTEKLQMNHQNVLKDHSINENYVHNTMNSKNKNFQQSDKSNLENNFHKHQLSSYNIHSFEKNKKFFNDRKDIVKKLSQLHNVLEKYTNNKMMEGKGEEIRKGVYLKKGIPLQFNPHIKNNINKLKQHSSPRPISTVDDFWEIENINDHNSVKKGKPHITEMLKSKNYKHFYPFSEDYKINIKRDVIDGNNYLKAYNRFMRDVDLFKFLYDENSSNNHLIG